MQYSREPALFWRENMVAVGILLRVCWEILLFCLRSIKSNFLTFLGKRSTVEPKSCLKSCPRSRRRPRI